MAGPQSQAIPPRELRDLPDGLIDQVESAARRILVQKVGSELQLLFDSAESCEIQSRLDLDRPLDLVSTYTQVALLGLLWKCPPRRVHVLGLGGGRIPMVLRHYFPELVIDCTESEPEITRLAVCYFGLECDARLKVHHEDGRDFLERHEASEPYDLIFVDAFSGLGFGEARLASAEFQELCRRRLSADGVLVLNILPGDPETDRKIDTVARVYPNAALVRAEDAVIVFGLTGSSTGRDELRRRAREIQRRYRLPFPATGAKRRLFPCILRREGRA